MREEMKNVLKFLTFLIFTASIDLFAINPIWQGIHSTEWDYSFNWFSQSIGLPGQIFSPESLPAHFPTNLGTNGASVLSFDFTGYPFTFVIGDSKGTPFTFGNSGSAEITVPTAICIFDCPVVLHSDLTSLTTTGSNGIVSFRQSFTSNGIPITLNAYRTTFISDNQNFANSTITLKDNASLSLDTQNALGTTSETSPSSLIVDTNASAFLVGATASCNVHSPITLNNGSTLTLTSYVISDLHIKNNITGTGALTISTTHPSCRFILSGDNTYTGATQVHNSTLVLAQEASLGNTALTVYSGATLMGLGSIGTGAKAVTNGGTVRPGVSGSPGTLTLNVTTYSQTGTLEIDIANASTYGQLAITGNATLAGTMNLSAVEPLNIPDGTTLTLLTASGTLDASALNIVDNFRPLSHYTPLIESHSILLTNVYIPHPPVIPTHAVTYAAPVLSGAQQTILNFTRHLQRMRPASRAENNSRKIASTPDRLSYIADSHLFETQYSDETETVAANFYHGITPSAVKIAPRTMRTYGFFIDALGSVGQVYATPESVPVNYSSAGGELGFDYVDTWYGLGFSPQYESISGHTVDRLHYFRIQSAIGTIFATFMPMQNNHFFIDAILGGGYQRYHFTKSTPQGNVTGNCGGAQCTAYGDIGYTLKMFAKEIYITPLLGLGYVGIFVDDFQEKGHIEQSFHVGSNTVQSLRSSLGISGNALIEGKTVSFIPEGRFLWQHEFLDHQHGINYASAALLTNAQVQVFGLGRSTTFLGANVRLLFPASFEFYTSYDYEWNSSFHSHLFYGSIEKRF